MSLKYAECFPHCHCEDLSQVILGLGPGFWSSGAYLVSALLLSRVIKRRDSIFELWFFSLVILGLSSFIFHATFTLLAVALDYASIAFAMSIFVVLKLLRPLRFSPRKENLLLLLYYLLLWTIFHQFSKWVRIGICVVIFAITTMEVLDQVKRPLRHHRHLGYSLCILIISFCFFIFEETEIWCNPSFFIQGHTLWHLGSALAIFFYGKWRFNSLPQAR